MKKRKFVWPRNFKPGFQFIDELGQPVEVAGDIEKNSEKTYSCSIWILSPDLKKRIAKTCKFFETTAAGMIKLKKYKNFFAKSV